MAKKPFHFTVRDKNVRCFDCGRPIKSNLVTRKEPQNRPKYCYKHHRERVLAHRKRQWG